MALGHSPQIVTQGLVFYIDPSNTKSYAGFGNTIYNMVNSSIGGTFVGYTSNPIDNTFTRSLAYDGSANYIQTNYIPYFTSDFTIEVWANFSRYNNYQCILTSMDNGNATNGLWFEFGSDRGFTIFTTGSQLVLEDNIVNLSNLELNKWHHIAVSRIGTGTNNIKLYVNNTLCGQNTYTAAIGHTSRNMLIGKYDYAGNYSYFKGSLGLVQIYNRGLSATEILQNYNTTRKKYYPEERIVTDGLILNLDPANRNSYPGTGNQIYDLSGSGNTGTLINSPTFSSLNGGQINMPGSSKYIDLGQKFNFTSENFSISTWVYLDSFVTINNPGQAPVAFFKGDFQQMGYFSQIFSDGSFGIFTSQGGSSQFSNSLAGILTTSAWNNLSYVRNGSSIRLYLNGIDRTSVAGTHLNPGSSNQTFKINYYKGDYLISGQMRTSQFLIYNRALTQQEIQQNYNATKNRFVNALPPVNDGSLSYFIDPGDVRTYPGTGNTIYNLVTSGFGGTIVGGVTYSGVGGTANFTFNGASTFIHIGNRPTKTTGSSISFFVKTTTTIANGFLVVTSADGGVYINRFNTSGQILAFFDQSTGNNSSADISTVSINDGRWHYVTATTNRSTTSMYIDGIFNKSYSETASTLGDNYAYIGGSFEGIQPFTGSIGIVQIHNRALSAVEIKQNFDYYRTRYGI